MLIPRDFNEIARQFLAKSCKIRNPGATGKSEPRGLTSDAVVIELTEKFSCAWSKVGKTAAVNSEIENLTLEKFRGRRHPRAGGGVG